MDKESISLSKGRGASLIGGRFNIGFADKKNGNKFQFNRHTSQCLFTPQWWQTKIGRVNARLVDTYTQFSKQITSNRKYSCTYVDLNTNEIITVIFWLWNFGSPVDLAGPFNVNCEYCVGSARHTVHSCGAGRAGQRSLR